MRRELHPRRGRGRRRRAPARWSSWRRDGTRREWTFGELADAAARARRPARTRCGVRRGDVVLTLVGNRPEWALTMLACFRQGFVVLPCTEQLRPQGPRAAPGRRAAAARGRRRAQRSRRCARPAGPATRCGCRSSDASHTRRAARPSSRPSDPCLITFTSRHRRASRRRSCTASATCTGQRLQAEHWLAPRPRPARVVHGRRGLVEVRPQRVHRALAARRRGAAARRALRPARAAGADRARARRRALHGADRVPRDRQARDAAPAAVAAAAWSPPARRSTPRSCTPGTRRPACGSATATARPRPAS